MSTNIKKKKNFLILRLTMESKRLKYSIIYKYLLYYIGIEYIPNKNIVSLDLEDS